MSEPVRLRIHVTTSDGELLESDEVEIDLDHEARDLRSAKLAGSLLVEESFSIVRARQKQAHDG